MHTIEFDGGRLHFNSDWSGDVIVAIGHPVDGRVVHVPGAAFRAATEHIERHGAEQDEGDSA